MTNAIEKFIAENDLSEWTILGEYMSGKLIHTPARDLMDIYRDNCWDEANVIQEYGDAQTFKAISDLTDSLIGSDVEEILNEALNKALIKLTEIAHDAACKALDAKVYDRDVQEFGPLTADRIVQAGTDFDEIGVWVAKNGGYTWCKLADTEDYLEESK